MPSAPRAFKAHLPESFDPSVTRSQWTAYASWVVSAVVIRRFIDREADETTFVPLDSRYVEKHVPAKVRRPLLDDLLREGVLECDGTYHFGHHSGRQAGRHVAGGPGKCLCYRLGERHRGARIRPQTLTHRKLLKKMARSWQDERDEVTGPVHLALRAWHDRVEVLPTAPYGEHPLLDRIIDGERRFTVCAQGRVHTNVANLPRQYRQFIRLDGRELASCDISTSQPLLLALLLRNRRKEEGREGRGNRKAVFSHFADACLSRFLLDCLDGSAYDRLSDLTGYARDDVKSMFLAVVYGRPEHMHTIVGEGIRTLYPAVFDAVAGWNYRYGHGALPRLMQTLESGVMIGRVAARLLREHPEMPLLTVHDSVVVPTEYVAAAQRVIGEEWSAQFGVEPRVKTSVFTAPQVPREVRATRPRRSDTGDVRTPLRPPPAESREELPAGGLGL